MSETTVRSDADQALDIDVPSFKLRDAMTPGALVEFDPDEAEWAGAFVEDALTETDAWESAWDLLDTDRESRRE